MKNFIVTLMALGMLLLSATPVMADSYSGPYSGPSESKNILIDKRVGVPHDTKGGTNYEYIDNVSTDRYTFKPHSVVFFEIRVKNTSTVRLHDVMVVDYSPDYFNLYENPGTLSTDKRTLSFNAGDFGPGEEKVFVIRGRIYHDDNVPTGTRCIVNRVRASSEGVSSEDTAQFCFHKGSAPVTKGGTVVPTPEHIPSTGAADGMLIISMASLLGYTGLRLKKSA